MNELEAGTVLLLAALGGMFIGLFDGWRCYVFSAPFIFVAVRLLAVWT